MNGDEFVKWFGDITKSENCQKWTDEDELNSLWDNYISFVNELKEEGHKVMRNDAGKHKII